ncbi:MAG: CRISPR system precrRNA processing endoribonuclease RAMP protein Cas6 [Ignisphaera sp.]
MPIDVFGFILTSNSRSRLGYSSGFYLRGVFYNVLKSTDPAMATRLHEYGGLAPFSISMLIEIDANTYFFRVASYLTRLSEIILKSFTKHRELKIMDNAYQLIEISCKRIKLEELIRNAEPLRRYEVEFISPTCFRRPSPYIPLHAVGFFAKIMKFIGGPRSHYRFYPLPEPVLMFRNIKRQWDQYAGVTLIGRRFTKWLEEGGVAISGVSDIKTHRLLDRRRKRFFVGFTGRVRLSLPEDTFIEENARAVNVLLRIGEETQVGINRTAGFGMYKILKAK